MKETNEKNNNNDFNVFGTKISQQIIYGSITLFFSIGSLLTLLLSHKFSLSYRNAVPFEQGTEKTPVYVTGSITIEEIGSTNIKSGKYLAIDERSEVYAWAHAVSKQQNNFARTEWTENPQDPETFPAGSGRGKPFHKKSLNLKTISNPTASIVFNGKKIKFDPSKLDTSLGEGFKYEKPSVENLTLGKFNKIGKLEDYNKERLLVYENEECEVDYNVKVPSEGCERISLSVLKMQEGEFTLLGFANGDELVPFDDRIKVAKGNFENLKEYYSSYDSISGFFESFPQFFLFLGIWLGFYFLKEKLPKIELISGFSDVKQAGILALCTTIIIKLVFNPWWTIALVGFVGYVYFKLPKKQS
ncbi:MAG: hypothetical protein SFU98_00660 [Leptospiraceae bacterium]|nr:hypothetical protein [Leptospiraceae bacterium]